MLVGDELLTLLRVPVNFTTCSYILSFVHVIEQACTKYTIFPRIKAQAFVSFPVFKTQLLNKGGLYFQDQAFIFNRAE